MVHKPQPSFEEKGEPKRYQTEVPLFTSLTPYLVLSRHVSSRDNGGENHDLMARLMNCYYDRWSWRVRFVSLGTSTPGCLNWAVNPAARSDRGAYTLLAPLSGTFLQTMPDLVTPQMGHFLFPRSCPATRSAPSERSGY